MDLAEQHKVAVASDVFIGVQAKIPVEEKERHGGCLFIIRQSDRRKIVNPTIIGNPDPDLMESYVEFATEKARRLAEQHENDPHQVLSWQTRNPEKGQWGGAVLIETPDKEKFIFSFSGLPEHADEAFMFLLAIQLQLTTFGSCVALANISNNTFFLNNFGKQ